MQSLFHSRFNARPMQWSVAQCLLVCCWFPGGGGGQQMSHVHMQMDMGVGVAVGVGDTCIIVCGHTVNFRNTQLN